MVRSEIGRYNRERAKFGYSEQLGRRGRFVGRGKYKGKDCRDEVRSACRVGQAKTGPPTRSPSRHSPARSGRRKERIAPLCMLMQPRKGREPRPWQERERRQI